jgi:hypothetical protein
VIDTSDVDVFLGLDVGKGEHHASRHPGRQEGARPAPAQHRAQAPEVVREAPGQARNSTSRTRSACALWVIIPG